MDHYFQRLSRHNIKFIMHLASGFGASASFVVLGVILPDIIGSFHLTLAEAGSVPFMRSIGEVAAAVAVGLAVRRYGTWQMFLGGHLFIGLTMIFVGFTSVYTMFLALLVAGGMGLQFLVTPLTSMMSGIDPARPGRYVGFVFVAMGAANATTPLIVGWRLDRGDSWQGILLVLGLVVLLLFLVQQRLGPFSNTSRSGDPSLPLKDMLRNSRLWGLAVTMCVWAFSHIIIMVWLPSYVLDIIDVSRKVASVPLSSYVLGTIVSRLIIIRIADQYPARRLLMVAPVVASTFMIGVITVHSVEALALFSFCVGVANGGVIPTFFVYAGQLVIASARVFSVVFAALLIGETVAPALAGWIAQLYGLRWGLSPVFFSWGLTIVLLIVVPLVLREKGPQP